jgi:hypothetical protein
MVTLLLLLACDAGPADSPDTGGVDTAANEDTGADIIGGDTSVDTEDTGDEPVDTASEEEDEAAYEAFYDPEVIQEVVISISEADRDAMDAEAELERAEHPDDPQYSYVSAALAINGTTLENVGVRYKGKSSFQDWAGKPSLKVKLDEFENGLRYAGLKRLNLDSMVGDEAMCRSVVGYYLWREAGVAAPEANYARVYLSVEGGEPEYLGLYTNVEELDSAWVKHNFEENDGDLWEGLDSADFTSSGLTHFALAAGDGNAAALDHVREALQGHGDDFYADADKVVDMENFLDFWTLSIATGNRAGYPFHLGGFYTYMNPEDDRLVFAPADMDESFDTGTPVYAGYVTGSVAAFCLYYDDSCPDRYWAALADAVTYYESSDISTFAAAMQVLSDEAVQDDSRKNANGVVLTTSQVSQARDRLNYRIEMYPEWLRDRQGF